MHAVLHAQQRHHLGTLAGYALHERAAQSLSQCLVALHRGRQLAVVAGQYDAACAAYGYPAGSLQGLCCLVDEEGSELLPVEQSVGAAHQRAGYDMGLLEQLLLYADLQLGGAALQPVHLLVPAVAALLAGTQLADGLADGPQLGIVGMGLEAPLVGEGEHFVVHTRGVAYAQHVQPAVNELLADPVDGHVALCADEDLRLAAQRLVDGLHECRRLSRSRWSVHDGHVLGAQHLVHGVGLCGVQVVEAHVGEAVCLCRHLACGAVEEVAQVAQSALGAHGALQCFEHQAVAGLVEEEHHAYLPLAHLQVGQRRRVGHADHHAVAVDVAHGAGDG